MQCLRRVKLACAAALALVHLAAAPPAVAQGSATLDAVKARGAVRCGVSTGFPGFAAPDSRGEWRGLDVDACRAVAAAALGDAAKVQYVPLTAVQRLPALTSGEVDMLARNTTWSLGRATTQGVNFVVINYYDGTGLMVPRPSNVTRLEQLNGSTICIQPGTETGLAVQDAFRRRNARFTPLMIEQADQLAAAYFAGRCDALASDQTQLAGFRSRAPNAAEHVILPELVSKEPLSVAVRYGDDRWANIVRWSVWALIEAEELGLASGNVVAARESQEPAVQRFLGRTGDLGQGLGLDNAWAARIVEQVGNYAESFERNVVPLGIARGPNRLWRDGGLLIAPPFR
ncbi:amino acid ABC transporter substrate-binding protein [Falsiroseomonas sp.]|uniref:amino acid ABC transporter substrate-binding protein n=1 Tax=Falsiroseomonas sp. TaxID=2870721 RepID=UPI00356528DC